MRILKTSLLCCVLTAGLFGTFTNTSFAWLAGPPAYQTGAPSDLESCGGGGCHNSFPVNSGGADFSIIAPDTYTPGKAIKIKVSFGNSSGKSHGFEMTAIDANGNRVGTFKKIGATTQVIQPDDERGLESTDKNKYIENTFKGAKKKKWKFKWTPPSDAADPITFYAAGCDADGKGTAGDDHTYKTTMEINAASSAP